MGRKRLYVLPILALLAFTRAAPTKPLKPPRKVDLEATDKDVHSKLEQLHKVIDSLQATVAGLKGGYDQHAKENAEKMKKKFERLTAVVSKLGQEKIQLFVENKRLRQDKGALVDKISALEAQLRRKAEAAKNSGAEAWLRKTAQDLKIFLEENGLEHYASPQFSPLVAGLVSNGVVLLPLMATCFFLLRYVKQLTVLRIVMAFNLFDLAFIVAMTGSCALLLGDVFEGLRHISEVNFMFIQLVLAAVFWITCAFLVAAVYQNRKNKAWKYAAAELVLKGLIAVDYSHRVWSPVLSREDASIALPPIHYVVYLCASFAAIKLTLNANTCALSAHRLALTKESDPEALGPLITEHDD